MAAYKFKSNIVVVSEKKSFEIVTTDDGRTMDDGGYYPVIFAGAPGIGELKKQQQRSQLAGGRTKVLIIQAYSD